MFIYMFYLYILHVYIHVYSIYILVIHLQNLLRVTIMNYLYSDSRSTLSTEQFDILHQDLELFVFFYITIYFVYVAILTVFDPVMLHFINYLHFINESYIYSVVMIGLLSLFAKANRL